MLRIKSFERNWFFATNSNIINPISFQPDGVNFLYLKFTLFIVWNLKGLQHCIAKLDIAIRRSQSVANIHFLCKTSQNFVKS